MDETDDMLVLRAKAGELDAFETLATRYERRVYSHALRLVRQEEDAEDVTQQTFLSVVEHLADFRQEASFATWLLRIATYAALKTITLYQEGQPYELPLAFRERLHQTLRQRWQEKHAANHP